MKSAHWRADSLLVNAETGAFQLSCMGPAHIHVSAALKESAKEAQ